REAHAIHDSPPCSVRRLERHGEVGDLQERRCLLRKHFRSFRLCDSHHHSRLLFGSSRTRSASPRKLSASNVTAMSTQGHSSNHQRTCTVFSSLNPAEARLPQLGSGSCTPMPRKLRNDSERIA